MRQSWEALISVPQSPGAYTSRSYTAQVNQRFRDSSHIRLVKLKLRGPSY